MRILVTGCLGLIGSEIVSQLVDRNHDVLGIDDMSHNCISPQESKATTFWQQSVADHYTPFHLDLIIHCASPVGHARLTPEAQTAWHIVRDTQAMLELAAMTGARLVTFSSSEVLTYRGETDIRAQYALGKLTGEAMVLGHPTVSAQVIRPYNVTGRLQRADGGFVMARFREAVKAGRTLTVFGDGTQVRHFLHVSDFARFVAVLVEQWPAHKGRWSVFAPRNGATMRQLAAMFHDPVGWSYRTVGGFLTMCDGRVSLNNPNWRDSAERPLDMAEYDACARLGWVPLMTLDEIVKDHLK